MIPVCVFTVLYNLPKFFELRTKILPVLDEIADRNVTLGNLTDLGAVPYNHTAFIGDDENEEVKANYSYNATWTEEMIEVSKSK